MAQIVLHDESDVVTVVDACDDAALAVVAESKLRGELLIDAGDRHMSSSPIVCFKNLPRQYRGDFERKQG